MAHPSRARSEAWTWDGWQAALCSRPSAKRLKVCDRRCCSQTQNARTLAGLRASAHLPPVKHAHSSLRQRSTTLVQGAKHAAQALRAHERCPFPRDTTSPCGLCAQASAQCQSWTFKPSYSRHRSQPSSARTAWPLSPAKGAGARWTPST